MQERRKSHKCSHDFVKSLSHERRKPLSQERKTYAEETKKQEILSNFTSQNVLAFIGDFAEHLFKYEDDGTNYDTWDNWHNLHRWVCTECGEENDTNADTCRDCGQALELEF